jgi:Ca2+-dependent lipid-binding protein
MTTMASSPNKGLTPAQAMTRITGTIFDNDSDVPAALQETLVTIVSSYDKFQKSIDQVKPAIESLLYWEAFAAASYVTFGIFSAWFVGRFGWSFVWILIILSFVGGAFRRNFQNAKYKIEIDAGRLLALRRMEDEAETVEWLNKFVHRFWTQYEPSLSESIKDSVGSTLASSKPAYLDDLLLSVFTLGSMPPRIESIRSLAKTPDDVHIMDIDFNFTPVDEDMVSKREKELGDVRQSKIEVVAKVGKGVASIALPVVVANIEFRGRLRLGFKFMPKYPHIQAVEYSLLETPIINMVLRPLKSLDMMDVIHIF